MYVYIVNFFYTKLYIFFVSYYYKYYFYKMMYTPQTLRNEFSLVLKVKKLMCHWILNTENLSFADNFKNTFNIEFNTFCQQLTVNEKFLKYDIQRFINSNNEFINAHEFWQESTKLLRNTLRLSSKMRRFFAKYNYRISSLNSEQIIQDTTYQNDSNSLLYVTPEEYSIVEQFNLQNRNFSKKFWGNLNNDLFSTEDSYIQNQSSQVSLPQPDNIKSSNVLQEATTSPQVIADPSATSTSPQVIADPSATSTIETNNRQVNELKSEKTSNILKTNNSTETAVKYTKDSFFKTNVEISTTLTYVCTIKNHNIKIGPKIKIYPFNNNSLQLMVHIEPIKNQKLHKTWCSEIQTKCKWIYTKLYITKKNKIFSIECTKSLPNNFSVNIGTTPNNIVKNKYICIEKNINNVILSKYMITRKSFNNNFPSIKIKIIYFPQINLN